MKLELEKYRVLKGKWATDPNADYGLFYVPFDKTNVKLQVVCGPMKNTGQNVSVSLLKRCPNWIEMSHVKDLFWDENETVLQFHPKKNQYVNIHQFCLHLWRHQEIEHPLPPLFMV